MDELRKAPYNTLRKARIKADAVAMALWRKSFAAMVLACTSIHIFIDSSPQWKGFEFLATSFDCYHQGQYFARRLFPAVSLSRCLFTALGKTVSFLWQLFLLVGPSFPMLRAWLSRVIAMTTDMGVEAAIYKMPDILPAFCRYLNISVRDGTPGKWLFPNCIFIAGWRHRIDTLIMRGLSNLSFFPAFLENFKALISFLRENMAELVRDLRSRGLMGLAAIMDKASLPEFAKWRWGTLARCCHEASKWVLSLAAHFSSMPFRKTRDPTRLTRVCKALSNTWCFHFGYVFWFMTKMDVIQQYAGSCTCHTDTGAASA
jgi:hypothetical protein